MRSVLARCALALALLGWVAAANERLELIATSFAYFYAYAIPIFIIAGAAIILLSRSFKDIIATRRPDWHVIVFRAVPKPTQFAFVLLALAAFGYIVLSTGGTSMSATSWETASPSLRSALFAGFTNPALLAWVALVASARAAP